LQRARRRTTGWCGARGRLRIPDTDAFIEAVLSAAITNDRARKTLVTNFDKFGLRRIFEAMGSFTKPYSGARSAAAGRNLMGWLYEGTIFNRGVVRSESVVFRTRLAAALEHADVKGVTIAEQATLHFDVQLNRVGEAQNFKQSSDHTRLHPTFTSGPSSTHGRQPALPLRVCLDHRSHSLRTLQVSRRPGQVSFP
jgi:hypothetical protein